MISDMVLLCISLVLNPAIRLKELEKEWNHDSETTKEVKTMFINEVRCH